MSDSGSGAEDPIDVLCHEFEQAWLRGERPQIESVLGRLTAFERPEALSQLLLIELECLQKTQAVPDVDAYVARFPHDATLVRLVLRAFEGDASEIEAASVISERIGSEIGRYKLLEQIGVGGMGVVYMAEQLRPVRRRVALKIIKPGMDSKHVIARFEVERQALAMMEHPNIARVLDAGCTDSGRPYFVMELVRGIPITEYCDLNKLKSQERLQLFVMVCQAVQHAHTKGIIHRDIKPTNVLVTLHDGVPVPKVIDFGVAKATGQQLTERTLFTSFGQMVGTPLYMSPEQAELSGLDVDTRSDIYSLGVLLYELLTGTTPFDRQRLQAAALDEMRRIIREEEPEKPSTRVSTMGPASVVASSDRSTDPTKLRQQLRGELDWIVMKALEKDRNRRYLTASDVAAEVTRYLNGDPIDAGPPSTAYRLRKIVGRYKSQVAVTCGFFALVLGFAVVASVLYVSADRARHSAIATKTDLIAERDRAQKERNRAEHEKARADRQAETLSRRVYDLNIINAQTAADRENVAESLALLDSCEPAHRRWEWYRLNHKLRHHIVTQYPSPPQPFAGVVASPDAARFALFGDDGIVRVLGSDGRELLVDSSDIPYVRGISFSPQGDLLCISRWNRQPQQKSDFDDSLQSNLRVFELETQQLLWQLNDSSALIGAVQFSPDGTSLGLWRGGHQPFHGRVELRGARTGDEIWAVPDERWPFELAFSPDGKRLYLNCLSQFSYLHPSTLACWNVDNQTELWAANRNVTTEMEISGDGQWLLTGGPNHSVQIWNAASGLQVDNLSNSGQATNAAGIEYGIAGELAISRDGQRFLSRCNQCITVWDWATRRPLRTILQPKTKNTHHMSFSANNQQLILADSRYGSGVVMRDIDPIGAELQLTGGDGIKAARFSPDGSELLSLSRDGTARTWDTTTGQVTWIAHLAAAESGVVEYSPAGDFIATAGSDGVKLWQSRTKQLAAHWPDATDIKCLAFDSAGHNLAAGGRCLRVWQVVTGHQLVAREVEEVILDLAFISATNRLAIIDDAGNVDMFAIDRQDTERWRTESRSIPEKNVDLPSECLAYDPNSQQLAIGILERIELRDLHGNLRQTLHNNNVAVLCLEFSSDGSRLFAGDAAGNLSVWNVESGVKLLNVPTAHRQVTSISVSPDQKTLSTAGLDRFVTIWETARPVAALAEQRRLVQVATEIVANKWAESSNLDELRAQLKADETIADQVLPIALAIANTRAAEFRVQASSD
ncbi:MAG: protein kinase [Planctomycetales bacterium]|nr:protein kinase [Planctomycetales bacterium]